MLSCEPLLGRINFSVFRWGQESLKNLWVVVGGESGNGARECQVDWIRSLVRQCQTGGVKVFVKQMGAHVIDRNDAGFEAEFNDGKGWPGSVRIEDVDSGYQGAPVRIHLKDSKGGDPLEWPSDLRIREFPEVHA